MRSIFAAFLVLLALYVAANAADVSNPQTDQSALTTNKGQLPGTTTNDNASAGNVGEYTSSIVLSGSAVSLSSGVAKDITTLTLSAGDWDVSGICGTQPANSAVVTIYICNITTTANTLNNIPSDGGAFGFNNSTQAANGGEAVPTDIARVSITGSTTYHLVASATFATGSGQTVGGYGKIRARRVR